MRHLCLNHHHCHQNFYAYSCQLILAPLFPHQVETFHFKRVHPQTGLLLQALDTAQVLHGFTSVPLTFFLAPTPSSPSSCHFTYAICFLSYMYISCSPIHMSSRSFTSPYCFLKIYYPPNRILIGRESVTTAQFALCKSPSHSNALLLYLSRRRVMVYLRKFF